MSTVKEGSLLVAQDDITDYQTGDVMIRKDSHMMYLRRIENRLLYLGHLVIESSTLKKFVLDSGVEIVDADGQGTLFVVRARFPDQPIFARAMRAGVVRT